MSSNNDHPLRKFFDALYEITPDSIVEWYRNMPRRMKIMLGSLLVATIFAIAITVLARIAVDAYLWETRTPLEERLVAPYEIEGRSVPIVNVEALANRPIPKVDGAAIEIERQEAVNAAIQEQLTEFEAGLPTAEPTVPPTETPVPTPTPEPTATPEPVEGEATDEAVPDEPTPDESANNQEEPTAEPTALAFMPDIDEPGIRFAIQPATDPGYFVVMPELTGYVLTYIYDNLTTHPATDCLVSKYSVTGDETDRCRLTHDVNFIEAADYNDVDGNSIRVITAEMGSSRQARETLAEIQRYARRVGGMGNYAVGSTRPVGYFYANANGWNLFGWSNGNWVYMFASNSTETIDGIMPFMPF